MYIILIYIVGYLISVMNRLFYRLVGGNRAVCYITGFIGTPLHELSHAVLCILFFHKITEIKLFQFDSETGVLGYVNHTYNKRNIYQQIGNFFIGVAPIVCGTLVLYALMRIMIPDVYEGISLNIRYFANNIVRGNENIFSIFFHCLWEVIKCFFVRGIGDWKWWIYLLLCFCVSLHLNLSSADIKGSLVALPILVFFIILINVILYYVSKSVFLSFSEAMLIGGGYLAGCLSLAFFFMLIVLGIGQIVWLIRCFTGKKK